MTPKSELAVASVDRYLASLRSSLWVRLRHVRQQHRHVQQPPRPHRVRGHRHPPPLREGRAQLLSRIFVTWNHRVLRTDNTDGSDFFSVVEVFYNEDGSLIGYSNASANGETLDDVRQDLAWMLAALDKPVINRSEFDA